MPKRLFFLVLAAVLVAVRRAKELDQARSDVAAFTFLPTMISEI